MTLAYDDLGNQLLDATNGRGVAHEFDAFDLVRTVIFDRFRIQDRREGGVTSITDPTGARHTIRPFPGGLILKGLSNGTDELTQYQYDGKWVTKATCVHTDSVRRWVRRFVDPAENNLIRIEQNDRGTCEDAYDSDQLLITERLPDGTKRSFRHDAAGNLLEQPGLSQVSVGPRHRLEWANAELFEYDDNNRIRARRRVNGDVDNGYDGSGRLTSCRVPGGDWRARYDPFGRRLWKSYLDRRVEFFWDRQRLAAEHIGGGLLRLYIYANPEAIVPFAFVDYDSLDADVTSGRRHFIFTNQIGAPIRVESDTGKVVWSATIDPYGSIAVSPESRIDS